MSCSVRFGSVRFGLVWFGLVWFGLVWFGTVRLGSVISFIYFMLGTCRIYKLALTGTAAVPVSYDNNKCNMSLLFYIILMH